jgi:hypothetical protein
MQPRGETPIASLPASFSLGCTWRAPESYSLMAAYREPKRKFEDRASQNV